MADQFPWWEVTKRVRKRWLGAVVAVSLGVAVVGASWERILISAVVSTACAGFYYLLSTLLDRNARCRQHELLEDPWTESE